MESVPKQLEVTNESGATATAVVVIGAGAGGAAALCEILPTISAGFPACIIIVQNMRRGFTKILASELANASELVVTEAVDGQPLRQGTVLVAPGASLLQIENIEGLGPSVRLEEIDDVEKTRTRVDACMASAAQIYGARAVGVLLSGLGTDGAQGFKAIMDRGGRTLAQDEISSVVFDMPKAASDAGVVDEVVPLWSIADRLEDLIGELNGSFLQEATG